MIFIYDISIAFFIGVVFYSFQVFLVKFRKRRNAQRELNFIINNLIDLICLIIRHYYSKEKLIKIRFSNNPQEYIFNNIDEVSKFIEVNLKLNDTIKFEWNKNKLTFVDEFEKVVNQFTTDYREIILKYGDCLEEKTLNHLEKIHRNYIFINFREYKGMFSKINLFSCEVRGLLINMCNVQKTANKINDYVKLS